MRVPLTPEEHFDLKREAATMVGAPRLCPSRACRRSRCCMGASVRAMERNEPPCTRIMPDGIYAQFAALVLATVRMIQAPLPDAAVARAPRSARCFLRRVIRLRRAAQLQALIRAKPADLLRQTLADPESPECRMLRSVAAPPSFRPHCRPAHAPADQAPAGGTSARPMRLD